MMNKDQVADQPSEVGQSLVSHRTLICVKFSFVMYEILLWTDLFKRTMNCEVLPAHPPIYFIQDKKISYDSFQNRRSM